MHALVVAVCTGLTGDFGAEADKVRAAYLEAAGQLSEFELKYVWKNNVKTYLGRIALQLGRFEIDEPRNTPDETRGTYTFDGKRWRLFAKDQEGTFSSIRLLKKTPPLIEDFTPLEALGLAKEPGQSEGSVAWLLTKGQPVGAKAQETGVEFELLWKGSRFFLLVERPPHSRFLRSRQVLEFVKEQAKKTERFIENKDFKLADGVWYPTKSQMGYVDFFENSGRFTGELDITEFSPKSRVDLSKYEALERSGTIDVRDDITRQLRKGSQTAKRDAEHAQKAAAAVETNEAAAALKASGSTLAATPPLSPWDWAARGALLVALVAGLLWVVQAIRSRRVV